MTALDPDRVVSIITPWGDKAISVRALLDLSLHLTEQIGQLYREADDAARKTGEVWLVGYWQNGRLMSDEEFSLEDAARFCVAMTESGTGAPESITLPDDTVIRGEELWDVSSGRP